MARPMRTRFFATLAVVLLCPAATVHAAPEDDETPPDARLEGYAREAGARGPLVIKPEAGTTTTWFLAIVLTGLCVGVMSKNGKRSHLD